MPAQLDDLLCVMAPRPTSALTTFARQGPSLQPRWWRWPELNGTSHAGKRRNVRADFGHLA